jgi:sugar/nucleoside kinase (ribokinase family)
VREAIGRLAQRFPDKVFWVDSRLRPEHFRHVIIKPNEDETNAACERIANPGDFRALLQYTEAPLLLVTHGARGVLILGDDREDWVPTVPVEKPVDICGAGDSFSAGAALALAITRDPVAAGGFGNLVASVTIMKKGTGTASPDELRRQWARLGS